MSLHTLKSSRTEQNIESLKIHLTSHYLITKVLAQARPSSSTKIYNRLLVVQHIESIHYKVFITRMNGEPADLCKSFSFFFVEISAAVFIPVKRYPCINMFLSLVNSYFISQSYNHEAILFSA